MSADVGVGFIERAELSVRWAAYDPAHYAFFETLLEKFDLWIPLEARRRFMVPCLLPLRSQEEDVGLEWEQVNPVSQYSPHYTGHRTQDAGSRTHYTPHSTHDAVHNTLHSTFTTLHYTLHTTRHSTHCTTHYHYTHYAVHPTRHTHCTTHTTTHTTQYTLHTTHYTQTTHYTRDAGHCTHTQ